VATSGIAAVSSSEEADWRLKVVNRCSYSSMAADYGSYLLRQSGHFCCYAAKIAAATCCNCCGNLLSNCGYTAPIFNWEAVTLK